LQIDGQTVRAASRGDPAAFEALVRDTHRAVYGLVFRLVGNHDDAADVMQDVYLRVWRSLKTFRGDAAFSTWLYRVAANAALSHLKRRGREAEPVDPQELAATERAVAGPEEDAPVEAIEQAVARLPVPMRTAVVMKDMYGFSIAEIAKQVGATEGAVKVRLFRARRRLADELHAGGDVVPLKRRAKS
jgi:RNA polymerase sigma-70 factor, ECF subfamily